MTSDSTAVSLQRRTKAHMGLISLAACTIVLNSSYAFAGDGSSDSKKTEPLKGNVQTQSIAAEAGVKELEETSKYLRRAAADMIGEVERQQYVTVGSPNVIGSIVIPAIPIPTGQISTGQLLPPRPKWVGFYMSEISQSVAALLQEFNSLLQELTTLSVPDERAQQIAQSMKELTALAGDIQTHYRNLQLVTQGDKLENLKIGKEALAIYDDSKPMEEMLKKVFHLLKEKD